MGRQMQHGPAVCSALSTPKACAVLRAASSMGPSKQAFGARSDPPQHNGHCLRIAGSSRSADRETGSRRQTRVLSWFVSCLHALPHTPLLAMAAGWGRGTGHESLNKSRNGLFQTDVSPAALQVMRSRNGWNHIAHRQLDGCETGQQDH